MRLFTCDACGHIVFFENVRCTQCNHTLAYLPDAERVGALQAVEGEINLYEALNPQGAQYKLCANSVEHGVCNWAVPVSDANALCECCRLNDTIPDLTAPENLAAWSQLEAAKRRLFRSLRMLQLPIESAVERQNGLKFSFKADGPEAADKVFTGHDDGAITINISEADDPFREKLRKQLGEGYRTVLGHFRHEIGHYYWDRLVKESAMIAPCRVLFGDETIDYDEALKEHYANPPPSDWPLHYVSSYATMHPWEDWAETWAHYLHMVATLETAGGLGLTLRANPIAPSNVSTELASAEISLSSQAVAYDSFESLIDAWVPLTVGLNSLNRSMGIIDPYPFVLSTELIEKLRFVHDVIRHANATAEELDRLASDWNARLSSGEQTRLAQGAQPAESQVDTLESNTADQAGSEQPESASARAS